VPRRRRSFSPMSNPWITPSLLRRRRLPRLLGLLGLGSVAHGQGVAPAPVSPAPAEVVELSPFVTTAGSEKGYVATSSLAGSRVNTALKDIAAQIDVMTPEFLNDIGATNVDEAVAFSTNNGGPNEQNVGPNNGITTTRAGGRARGFDAITSSADFYATIFRVISTTSTASPSPTARNRSCSDWATRAAPSTSRPSAP
jgi:hypothetical protein